MIFTQLRIEEKLYEKIKKLATKDKRSINSEICHAIEKYVEQRLWQIANNK